MRITAVWITVCLAFGLSAADLAADAPPAPPAPPAPAGFGAASPPPGAPGRITPGNDPGSPVSRIRSVAVGPADSRGIPRRVRGHVLVTAVLPTDSMVVSIELFCNNALLGQRSQAPYQVDFDSTTVADGRQILKAVGLDASGKQAWTASTQIEVQNAKMPMPSLGAPTQGTAIGPAARPAVPGPVTLQKPAQAIAPGMARASNPSAPGPGKTYYFAKYGFSLRAPAGWTTKDKTVAMKPNQPGNAWMEFICKPGLVMNVRRMRLAPNSDAEAFAKYNPYVTKWERKTVVNSAAFATTTNEGPKKLVHRMIIVKDGYAWMLNCVDSTASSTEQNQMLFESVAESLDVRAKAPSTGVTLQEIRKKK